MLLNTWTQSHPHAAVVDYCPSLSSRFQEQKGYLLIEPLYVNKNFSKPQEATHEIVFLDILFCVLRAYIFLFLWPKTLLYKCSHNGERGINERNQKHPCFGILDPYSLWLKELPRYVKDYTEINEHAKTSSKLSKDSHLTQINQKTERSLHFH